ncbi:MAG: hypothetical protein WCA26_19365 [Xanthobacteraceae bacterium]
MIDTFDRGKGGLRRNRTLIWSVCATIRRCRNIEKSLTIAGLAGQMGFAQQLRNDNVKATA